MSSSQRLPVLPETPTVAESGYKDFETSDWKMLVAPAGTPAAVAERLNTEVAKAMSHPDTIAKLHAEGSLPMSGSPQEAAQLMKNEQQRWGTVVRESNVKAD